MYLWRKASPQLFRQLTEQLIMLLSQPKANSLVHAWPRTLKGGTKLHIISRILLTPSILQWKESHLLMSGPNVIIHSTGPKLHRIFERNIDPTHLAVNKLGNDSSLKSESTGTKHPSWAAILTKRSPSVFIEGWVKDILLGGIGQLHFSTSRTASYAWTKQRDTHPAIKRRCWFIAIRFYKNLLCFFQ